MTTLVALLLSGLFAVAAIIVGRLLDSRVWRRSLLAFRLRLPANLAAESVAQWLATVTASGGSRWRLLDAPPICLETVATHAGIASYLLVPESRQVAALASLRAALPGVRIEAAPRYFRAAAPFVRACELRLTSLTRPLAFERAEAATAVPVFAGAATTTTSKACFAVTAAAPA
jgi:hypothetical protein